MNETTSNPDTPSTPPSDHTPDAVVPATPPADATPPTGSIRRPVRLHRSRDERMIAGVCGGLAETLGVDAAVLRLALVLATVLGVGAGVILYVACWILIPKAPEPGEPAEPGATPHTEAATDLLPDVRPTV
jgi:phage shock protein C